MEFFGLLAITLQIRNLNINHLSFGLQVITRKYKDFALIQFNNTLLKILNKTILQIQIHFICT